MRDKIQWNVIVEPEVAVEYAGRSKIKKESFL